METTTNIATMSDKTALQLKALASANALVIIKSLMSARYCVTELCGITGLSQPAVSEVLIKLLHLDMASTVKEGKNKYYSIDRELVKSLAAMVYDIVK